MEIVTLDSISDKILDVTQSDIDEANMFLGDMAARLDVLEITKPSAMAKRLGVVYACYVRAVASVGTDPTASMDNGTDIFAQKADFYSAELKRISSTSAASDFTGAKSTGRATIKMYRS